LAVRGFKFNDYPYSKNDRVHLEEEWKIPNLYVILDTENNETNMKL